MMLFYEIFITYSSSSFTTRKKIRHGGFGFISHPKERVLWNFIALSNPSSSAWFEPANLGPNGKHTNHYTTNVTPEDFG
jgi:hypothetical protein